jgi:hypothetical protein
MQTVLLPGDDELFLASSIARAQRRDSQLNRDEHRVRQDGIQCAWRKYKYEDWRCTWRDPCHYCWEFLRG